MQNPIFVFLAIASNIFENAYLDVDAKCERVLNSCYSQVVVF